MNGRSLFLLLILILSSSDFYGQKVDMTIFHGIKPRNIGPSGQSGRVTAIAADPLNQDIMYIGTASGGLWKTTNGGTTFSPVFDDQAVASVGALAIDPLRHDIIWAGTGEGNPRNSVTGGYGIYKSLDGGKTWKLSGLQETRHIHRIIIDPHNSDIVYVGAIGTPWGPSAERGLFKTVDGGTTWKKILYNGETVGVADMVIDPSNPDKLFVAMWNHQRWPWFFNSGGPGSGLYLTLDGGNSFSRLTKGLPAEVGRIGVAIAKSRPDYVYAYVESKPNAIYRSTDGGFSWEKRAEKNIGTRPFYFAEIYVDPENENRIYTLFTGINISEDGGLNFSIPIAGTVHPDHHAWWINPFNPSHMADGNDGGLALTYDKGKTWRHVTNLPVGQFYHINTDNEMPYRVYGGMQDNGSWAGPAYVWYDGGIINEFWDFLDGGDGFDAMAVPGDPRFCYCQSQGGGLRRMDMITGSGKFIRPAPVNGEKLRFNWNAALAQDPFDGNTIYFGSQYIHKSINRGDSWEKISPDLTTNDPEKQKQSKSGGITPDATGAENHCTILSISPSKVREGLIWAGTDDGNIQYTNDGGKTWINVTDNLKGPKKAWIPQITASEYNPGEAFAVLNNYRLGDYSAYLYHTVNFGKTWQRIIDDHDVWGYVLCFVQDPKEPRLMFAGTEYGLYVSFDSGENWNRWTEGYPTVSTYDMVIQARESDLVIGTFGRSAWIIDDIGPLREVASSAGKMTESKLKVFDAPDAVNAARKNLPGYYYRGDGMFEGDNRKVAGMLTYYVSEIKGGKILAEITDSSGHVVKNIEADPEKGFNRIEWRLDRNPSPWAGQVNKGNENFAQEERARFLRGSGISVIPGRYQVKMSYNQTVAEGRINIIPDPRISAPNIGVMSANYRRADAMGDKITELNTRYQKFFDCGKIISNVDDLCKKYMVFGDSVRSIQVPFRSKFDTLDRKLTARPDGLFSKINSYRNYLFSPDRLSENEEKMVSEASDALEEARRALDDFLEKDWIRYRTELSRRNIPVNAILK